MKRLGTSIAIFGGIVFGSGIVLAPVLDALSIDIIALFLMLMGLDLRSGKRKTIKWPAIWCGWYCVISIGLVVGTLLAPEKVKVGKYHIEAGWQSTAIITLAISMFVWSGINLIGLLRNRNKCVTEQNDGQLSSESALSDEVSS